MINLIVAGGGEGTYKNLYPVTQSKNPDLGMRIHTVIDVVPHKELHPKMQDIIASESVHFIRGKEGVLIPIPENSAGVVMTPNASHLPWTEYFVSRGIPIYVEKPAATSLADLNRFLDIAARHPKLVYAAEYCVDGKGLGLLAACGSMRAGDPRNQYVTYRNHNVPQSPGRSSLSQDIVYFFRELGQLVEVCGTMLEGEGTAGTADHRAWLLEGSHGGMVRDLTSHLFGPLYDTGLVGADAFGLRVALGKHESGMALGTHRPLKSPAEGETFASIKGVFLAPHGLVPFHFMVGKYAPKHDRVLKLGFERGSVVLDYEKPFDCRIETPRGNTTLFLKVDFYPTLALLDFKRFIEGKTHGHIGRAAAIVRLNEAAREAGLRQAGLL